MYIIILIGEIVPCENIVHNNNNKVYDSDAGVCDRSNTRTNVMFQISPSTNEQKVWRQHSLSYVRMAIVYGKSYRVDRPLLQ